MELCLVKKTLITLGADWMIEKQIFLLPPPPDAKRGGGGGERYVTKNITLQRNAVKEKIALPVDHHPKVRPHPPVQFG